MNKKENYNGKSGRRSFHKLKKHMDIIQNKISFRRQKKEIESLDNAILNIVFKSILEVKESNYSKKDKKVFMSIEAYRKKLASNSGVISYEIFNSSATKQIKDIYKIAASPRVWGELLYVLAKKLKSEKVLEIGTNVGISGTYILNGMKQNHDGFQFTTMEGLNQLCLLCEEQFSEVTTRNNFDIISGLYDNTFPKLIANENNFDLVFIDGNHQKEPTLKYFEELKKCSNDKVVFIFDDIYYNLEMTEAWKIIICDKSVNYSIDLYKWGIAIIDKSETSHNKEFGIHLSYN